MRDRQDDPGASRGEGLWTCGWDVTLNDDWHDDVLCTNGVNQERPYLLPGDSFVTEQASFGPLPSTSLHATRLR